MSAVRKAKFDASNVSGAIARVIVNDNCDKSYDDNPSIIAIKEAMKQSEILGHPVVIRVQIDPETADWLLGENIENRRLSDPFLKKYQKDMKEGRWVENGDGIGVAKCGELNNGQHRLVSVIGTGVTIMTNVTVGLDRAARETNDIGLGRSLSNLLTMNGVPNATIIGHIAKMVIGLETTDTASRRSMRENSNPQIIARIAGDHAMAASAVFVRTVTVPKGIVSKPQLGFFHYVLGNINLQDAENFLRIMLAKSEIDENGVERGLVTGDPRLTAYQRLYEGQKDLKAHQRVEVVFRAWNAFREGRTITQIKLFGELPALV